jgi:hypothetical protein
MGTAKKKGERGSITTTLRAETETKVVGASDGPPTEIPAHRLDRKL